MCRHFPRWHVARRVAQRLRILQQDLEVRVLQDQFSARVDRDQPRGHNVSTPSFWDHRVPPSQSKGTDRAAKTADILALLKVCRPRDSESEEVSKVQTLISH